MSERYDIVTVGGGLGGAAVAATMARRGHRVLVLERTTEFTDRVRGEVLVPWGCVEAKRLDLLAPLAEACGHEVPFWDAMVGGMTVLHRDMRTATEEGLPVLMFYHAAMQNVVLGEAVRAGAEVRRGTRVTEVTPGASPAVVFADGEQSERVTARLVVGADGRGSPMRKRAGLEAKRDPERRMFAGVLLDGIAAPEDTMIGCFVPDQGLMSWVFPQGNGRARCYVGYASASDTKRFTGERDIGRFIDTAVTTGMPAEYYADAKVAGPLATFDATDEWVEHPFVDGLALVGDAAAMSDPTWGQGMSNTLRDVRVLTDALAADDDWNAAGHAYADEHDRGHRACHTADTWYTDLLLDVGPAADARRAKAVPLVLAEPDRIVDTPLAGPDLVVPDEAARVRMFGE